MSSHLPDNPKKGGLPDPFDEFFHSINHFFRKWPMKSLLESMDEFFQMPAGTFYVDVREEKDEHIITAELPGVKKEQISVDILDHFITISVIHEEIETRENEQKQQFSRRESYRRSVRRIYLGHPIDERTVQASFQNGLLKIRVPKQKAKRIHID